MIIASIVGNLGADAEVKEINGKHYASLRVASTSRRGTNPTTTWVSVLSSYSEKLMPYLKKGQSVFVSGEMDVKGFTKKDGSAGADVSMFASSLNLVGRAENGQQSNESAQADKLSTQSEKTAQAQNSAQISGLVKPGEEDLPF